MVERALRCSDERFCYLNMDDCFPKFDEEPVTPK
jgi:hypothetical protein